MIALGQSIILSATFYCIQYSKPLPIYILTVEKTYQYSTAMNFLVCFLVLPLQNGISLSNEFHGRLEDYIDLDDSGNFDNISNSNQSI